MMFCRHVARRAFAGRLLVALLGCAVGGARLHAQTEGTKRWGPFSVGGSIESSPAVGPDGTIYIGVEIRQTPASGKVLAIDRNGGTKWTFVAPNWVSSSPALGPDGTVYVGCEDGKLYALNGSTGKKIWEYDTQVYIALSSPALSPDGTAIYVGGGDAALHAVTTSGTSLWTKSVGDAIYSSPAVGPDGTIYFGSRDKNVYALDPADGSEKWHVATGDAVDSSPAIARDGTVVYIGSGDGMLYAISSSGTKLWTYSIGGQVLASPVLAPDGTIYIGATDRTFYAIKSDGTLKWKASLPKATVSTAAVRGDGIVIFGCDDGIVRALNPADGSEKWNYPPPSTTYIESSLVVASDGSIYTALLDGRIFALYGASNGSPVSTYSGWPMFRHDGPHTGASPVPLKGGQLVNLSTRGQVGGGANLIAGLVITGPAQKNYLLRGIGPALQSFGITNYLPDPNLQLFAGQTKLAEDDDWGSDAARVQTVSASVGAFALADGSKDAALVASLAPRDYTAVIGSVDGSAGVALVEAYDAAVSNAGARLINLSTRGRVGNGSSVLIPGLVVGGGSLRVLLRAVGPGLTDFGVTGALAQPVMTAFAGSTLLGSNTGWTSTGLKADLAAAALATGAFALRDGSADCAMLLTLNSGDNTIQVAGVGGTTGEVLVEVYLVP